MRIKTESLDLLLRPYRDDEIDAMAEKLQSYPVSRYLSIAGSQTPAMEREWLQEVSQDKNGYLWAICVVEDGTETPIGHTSFSFNGKIGVSGIVIYNRSWWRRGVAKTSHLARTLYAFDVVDLAAVRSGYMQQNRGSGRALESVGYRKTGTSYHLAVIEGQVCHVDELLLVNPAERAWNYFWGDTNIPKRFVHARQVTAAALEEARRLVEFP